MRRLVLLLTLAPLLLLVPAVPAAAEEETPSRFFEVYDKDTDGKVTPAELGADDGVFRLLDRDGDGAITPEDLQTPSANTPRRRPAKGDEGQPGRRGDRRGGGAGPDGERPGRGPEGQRPEGGRPKGERRGAGGPQGQGGPNRWKKMIERMDTDGDGRVSKVEFKGRMPFERLDSNSDGYLDDADAEAMRKARRPARTTDRPSDGSNRPSDGEGRPAARQRREALRAMDKDGDGKITREEYTGPVPFERLDRDGDGVLTKKDRPAPGTPGAAGTPGSEGRRGRAGGRGGRGGRGGQGGMPSLDRFDVDGDGKVSPTEFPGRRERFDDLDTNGDGVLSEADRKDGAPGTQPGRRKRTEQPKRRKRQATKGDAPTPVRLAKHDGDGNGKLSRNEFPGSDDAWRRLDKNRDGWITPEELVQPPAKPETAEPAKPETE